MLKYFVIVAIPIIIMGCSCQNDIKEEDLYGNWQLYYTKKALKEEYKYVIRDSSYIIMGNEMMLMSLEKEYGKIANDSFKWEFRNDTLRTHILNNPIGKTVNDLNHKQVFLSKNKDVMYLSSEYDEYYNITYVFNKR